MKKVLLVMSLVLLSGSASAQHYGHHGHHGHHGGHRGGNWGWGPVIGGVVAGAVIYDIYNRPQVVVQPPVVVQQQPVVVQQQQPQNCTPWTETQTYDGRITRTRTCTQ